MGEPLELTRSRYLDSTDDIVVVPRFYRDEESDVRHYHDFWELVLVEYGTGKHCTEDGNYCIYAGNVFLIRPGVVHAYSELRQLALFNILFRPEKLKNELNMLHALPGYANFFDYDPRLSGRYRFDNRISLDEEALQNALELIRRIREETAEKRSGWRFMRTTLFLELVCLICRAFETHTNRSEGTREITRIIQYLEENCGRPIRLEQLAAKFNKSLPTLNRLFRASLGKTPIGYLIELRLERAAARLRGTGDPVAHIAEECGFRDSNYFSSVFTRHFGASPRAYRVDFQRRERPNGPA